MKSEFWPAAARGGVIVGAVATAVATANAFFPRVGGVLSFVELFTVAYCIYVFGRRRGEQTYGQSMKFVLATMLLAGLVYGVGLYFLVNHWAVDFFTQHFGKMWDEMGSLMAVDREAMYAMVANPLLWLFSGVLAEVIYGGLVGLFVSAFIRKR